MRWITREEIEEDNQPGFIPVIDPLGVVLWIAFVFGVVVCVIWRIVP